MRKKKIPGVGARSFGTSYSAWWLDLSSMGSNPIRVIFRSDHNFTVL